MVSTLKWLTGGMCLTMTAIVIATCLKSDMFHLHPLVATEPWFTTTLTDFYFNITILSSWVIYRENNWFRSTVWIIAFICLGSIATAFYVFLQLLGLKEGQGMEKVLLRKERA
jgi:hypothetical protein